MELRCFILKIKNAIYTIEIRDEKYEVLNDRGETKTDYNNEYWSWWIEKIGYFNEKIDIFTLFDDELKIDDKINDVKEITWDSRDLIKALRELERESSLSLEFISYDDENQILKLEIDGEIKEFGTNKKIKFAQEEKKNNENKVIKKEKKIIAPAPKGSLADYYREQTNNYSRGK